MSTKPKDILDEIKEVDRAVRAQTLARILAQIKEKAKEVLSLKEEVNALLEATGLSSDDAKRVIDFVNSLDEVQLTDAEKKDIRESARDEVKGEKKKAEQKINESPFPHWAVASTHLKGTNYDNVTYGSSSLGTTYYSAPQDLKFQVMEDSLKIYDSNDKKSLDIKL